MKLLPTNKISKLSIKEQTLFIEGLAYIQGYDSPTHDTIIKHLQLHNIYTNKVIEHPLGITNRNDMVNVKYKEQHFNYRAAGVATIGFKGIDISNIDVGMYEIKISSSPSKDKRNYASLNLDMKHLDIRTINNRYEYRLFKNQNKAYLVKREILGRKISEDSYVSIDNAWIQDRKFHIEGKFIVPGVNITEFNQAKYYLIVKKPITQTQYAFELGQIKKPDLGQYINNPFGEYNACYYATKNLAGIDSSSFEFGVYDIYLSLGVGCEIFTIQLDKKLVISEDNCSFKE
ncbi:hypothetical protein EXH44_04340 [Actinobacillus indolicus]|uniref:Uncharacterized protein n=1 Tax=Actinobacillus indolicus TaxID=51049 RepID=A0A4V1AXY8_9PAST|nr:hypothetical protein [Actinobacillus indolicus]QBQ63520.1 hypothetical protein EXH44_04340 [Actinobacillus indolicus]